MESIGVAALKSSRVLARASTNLKNDALLNIASALDNNRRDLLAANNADMNNARENNLEAALLERLDLNDERIDAMIEGVRQVAAMPDLIGDITYLELRPS